MDETSLKLQDWIKNAALPLWSETGLDAKTGTVWEALDHAGQPCRDMERRLRVQARQAYCFARSGDPELGALALQLFRFAIDHGFDPVTDNLAAWLAPDTTIRTAPHDLYDMTFMLLAAAALTEAGYDVADDLARLEAALLRLKAPRGWYENAARTLPRRQNPHMHMFEAATALYQATGAERFRAMAQEALDLFRTVFLHPDGRVLELFDQDWTPLSGEAQVTEPGHMAEWVYLLDRYEAATGTACGIDLDQLFDAVLACRAPDGLLPDRSQPTLSPTRRMWPQTELLKAALTQQRRGRILPEDAQPPHVLGLLWQGYFETPVPGGWYDTRSLNGVLLSQNMPASTFYHIVVAFDFYIDTQAMAQG